MLPLALFRLLPSLMSASSDEVQGYCRSWLLTGAGHEGVAGQVHHESLARECCFEGVAANKAIKRSASLFEIQKAAFRYASAASLPSLSLMRGSRRSR